MMCAGARQARYFYFFIFYFHFLQKYIFDLEIYHPPPGRQGLIRKKKDDKKLRGGRPPLYKVLAAPHPLICLTKNPEKKKREGGRESQSGEALSDFQAGDFR